MLERLVIVAILGLVGAAAYVLMSRLYTRRVSAGAPSANARQTAPTSPRLLYFQSDGCAGCRAQKHHLEQLGDAHRSLIQAVDATKETDLARAYNILTLPTTVLIGSTGKVLNVNPGVTSAGTLRRQLSAI